MPNPDLTVIICTHNPRVDYLRRTLEALRAQSLPREQWEFLLIDNASKEPLAGTWDLSWHPQARHVLENDLGLTPARLRGVRESKADLIVFVDDDNLLAPDYLARAKELFSKRTDLGVASGRLMPEYETAPPDWFRPYESWIAVRRIEQSTWSNFGDSRSEPCGAGMCLRRDVALAYARAATDNTRQQILGRRGTSLLSGEDVAISKVALGMGYSMGQFVGLNAVHLIPTRRVDEKYLFQLYRNLQASGQLIGWLENPGEKPGRLPPWRVLAKAGLRWARGGRVEKRLVVEELRAFKLVRQTVAEASSNGTASRTAVPQKS